MSTTIHPPHIQRRRVPAPIAVIPEIPPPSGQQHSRRRAATYTSQQILSPSELDAIARSSAVPFPSSSPPSPPISPVPRRPRTAPQTGGLSPPPPHALVLSSDSDDGAPAPRGRKRSMSMRRPATTAEGDYERHRERELSPWLTSPPRRWGEGRTVYPVRALGYKSGRRSAEKLHGVHTPPPSASTLKLGRDTFVDQHRQSLPLTPPLTPASPELPVSLLFSCPPLERDAPLPSTPEQDPSRLTASSWFPPSPPPRVSRGKRLLQRFGLSGKE